jgi:acyl dehydratase
MSLFFEDFNPGAKFVSGGRLISAEDVAEFSALSGDVNRIHTDEDYARKTMFGRRIAQGAFVFSIATGLFTQMDLINDTLLAFYAVDKLRFRKPVFPGDTVQVEKQVIKVQELGAAKGLVTFAARVFNQAGETVIQYQERLLIRRKAI